MSDCVCVCLFLYFSDSSDKMPLRFGWKESIKLLSQHNIPLYVFSSGYGDIVQQTIIQQISETPLNTQAHTQPSNNINIQQIMQLLPQNIRIISNFFRTAPDGTVRAFSSPVVHERFVT